MAKKVQKSASEQLIEEIQTLGQTQGLNNVFTTFLEMLAVSLNAQVDVMIATISKQVFCPMHVMRIHKKFLFDYEIAER